MVKVGDLVLVRNVKKYPNCDFTGMQGEVIKIYNNISSYSACVVAVKFPNMCNNNSTHGVFYFEIGDIIAGVDLTQQKEIKHKENPYAKIGPKYNYVTKPDMCGKLYYDQDMARNNAVIRSVIAEIKTVKFNPPATIIFWKDGTKTVVKADNEEFDPEKGMAMAICKKVMGNGYNYYDTFRKFLPKEYRK